jgi:hypothetical protein
MSKLLVLGVDRGPDPRDQTDCYAFVSAALMQAFNKLIPGEARLVNVDVNSSLDDIRGEAEFVLFVGYLLLWNRLSLPEIRQRIGCRKIVSLCEYSFFAKEVGTPNKPDWAFRFLDDGAPCSTTIYAPLMKEYYKNEPKEKVILIDHGWPCLKNTESEWTFRISDWLAPLRNRFGTLRMTRYPEYEAPTWKPHEVALPMVPFREYLERTNRVETFVVTHFETYGFQIADMVARGIRVVTPPGMLHQTHIERFGLPIFRNSVELQQIVMSPVEPRWAELANCCTDYLDVAKTIIATLESL